MRCNAIRYKLSLHGPWVRKEKKKKKNYKESYLAFTCCVLGREKYCFTESIKHLLQELLFNNNPIVIKSD